jgi:SpoIID/LytB domain protein
LINSGYKRIALFLSFLIIMSAQNIFAAKYPNRTPEIKILVAQYTNNSLEFMMPEGGTWKLGNAASGELEAGVTYRIEGGLLTEAEKRYHLMVATVDLMDQQRYIDITEKYQKMGFRTHTISVGEAPKVSGMPDNRVIHIGIDAYRDKEKAEARKAALAAKQIKTWIYIENIMNSSGSLNMSGGDQHFTGAFGSDEGYTLKSVKGTILKNVEHSKGYSWHGFENRTYMGTLKVNFGFDDCLEVIEVTNLEDLLVGVVPSEISSKAPQAAMEAQAVAARGEIMSKKGLRHVNTGYDYCSEQHCQVYKGYQKIAPTIAEKIKDTTGVILMMKEYSKILDAVYSSNCGGHTSANQNIWIGFPNPHLQGVSDEKGTKKRDLTNEQEVKQYITNPPNSWCSQKGFEGADKYRWKKSISKDDWEKIEERAEIGKIKNISIEKRDVSGRIFEMTFTGSKGTKVFINELEIRQLFGGLRSSCFIAEYKKNKDGYIVSAELKGAGFGHGVGMCQTGAQSMAGSGYTYKQILEHYFPEARILKIY